MTAAGIRGGRGVTYRKPKERERATRYRHKGDSLTAVRLIGVTGWKINGLARMVQGWAKGAGRRRSRVSAPPSTSPSPSTTEVPKKDWEFMAEMNNSVYGNPSSLTIQNEKNIKTGTKFQSNLNEIGKSEQKSSELDRKGNYNWPPDKGEKGVREASYCLRALNESRKDSRKGRGEQKRVKETGKEEVIRPAEATAHQVVSDS
ncbi:hypothetical protein ALC57_09237 [Trachymyrmex cornetzi]|uniref:Uncharacterized protein n=1 Tax=Trachymyrmex cornetzi TaxID=471704 RepID=A0A195E0V1_9HYME|nr:hypothetical protein ALC57_09237 [Trachymyrmex cornetzi]